MHGVGNEFLPGFYGRSVMFFSCRGRYRARFARRDGILVLSVLCVLNRKTGGRRNSAKTREGRSLFTPKTEPENAVENQSTHMNCPEKRFGDVRVSVKADPGACWQADFLGNKAGREESRVGVAVCVGADRRFPGQTGCAVFRPQP